jgi:hypothetical protein
MWWFLLLFMLQVALWQNSYPFDVWMRIANSAWLNIIIEEGLLVHYPKPFRPSSCLKPYRLITLSEPSKIAAGIAPFCRPWARLNVSIATVKVNMIATLLSIASYDLSSVVSPLKSILHLIHCIHLLHLTLCWLSCSTLFAVPTLIFSVVPKSYLCKLTMIVHGSLGHLLLSVTIPYRERKPITRLVTFSWFLSLCNWSCTPWVKLIEGRFAWLICSSKLQSCLKLCWFTQAFLKPELQNGKRVPYRISKGVPFMTFFWIGWHITQDTYLEWRKLWVESRCYN